MKFNNFFKIVLTLTIICQANATFAMKRKREVEIQSYENKDLEDRFNCPYSGLECSAKKWSRVNKRICDNNREKGFYSNQTLSNHILNFHRACPLCPENQQTINTPVLELVQHIKCNHPDKVLYCPNCHDYIVLSLNGYTYKKHLKGCSPIEHKNSNNNDIFYNPITQEALNFLPQTFNQPPSTTTTYLQPQQNISIIQNIFNFNTFPQPQSQTNTYVAPTRSTSLVNRFETTSCPIYQPRLEEFITPDFCYTMPNNNNSPASLEEILAEDITHSQELLNKNNNNIEIQEKIKKAFDCPYSGQECKARRWGGRLVKITKESCNNNRGKGYDNNQTFYNHILNFHRTCPLCLEDKNSIGMPIVELGNHIKSAHPEKKSELFFCTRCNDLITFTSNKQVCIRQHAKECVKYEEPIKPTNTVTQSNQIIQPVQEELKSSSEFCRLQNPPNKIEINNNNNNNNNNNIQTASENEFLQSPLSELFNIIPDDFFTNAEGLPDVFENISEIEIPANKSHYDNNSVPSNHENKLNNSKLNCPLEGKPIKDCFGGVVQEKVCNNNNGRGFCSNLYVHMLMQHRVCLYCYQEDNPTQNDCSNTTVEELIEHAKKNHQKEFYSCQHCKNYLAHTQQILNAHERNCTAQKFICYSCGFQARTKRYLILHKENCLKKNTPGSEFLNPQSKLTQSPFCEFFNNILDDFFPNSEDAEPSLNEHVPLLENSNLSCPFQGKPIKTFYKGLQQEKVCTNRGGKGFSGNIYEHVLTYHRICLYCYQEENLTAHNYLNTGVDELVEHAKNNHQKEFYYCQYCKEYISHSKNVISNHVKSCPSKNLPNFESINPENSDLISSFETLGDDFPFDRIKITEHSVAEDESFLFQNSSHEIEINNSESLPQNELTIDEQLKNILDNFFTNHEDLADTFENISKAHETTNNNDVTVSDSKNQKLQMKQVCTQCAPIKTFKRNADYHNHILNKHRICPWCDSFTTAQTCTTLIEHFNLNHFNKPNTKQKNLLLCDICNNYIATRSNHSSFPRHEKTCKKRIQSISKKQIKKDSTRKKNLKKSSRAIYQKNMESKVPEPQLVFEIVNLETDPLFSDEESQDEETKMVTEAEISDAKIDETLLINQSCHSCNPSLQKEDDSNPIPPHLTVEEYCPNCGFLM